MRSKFLWSLVGVVVVFGFLWALKNLPETSQWLWSLSAGGTKLFPLVTITALIDSINPCAFSILLVTIALLFSLGTLRQGILKIGGLYIAGIFLAYLLIGFGIFQVLHLFNTPHFMGQVGAFLLLTLGLISLLGEFIPRFPIRLGIPRGAHVRMAALLEKISLPAAFLLGALVGLCEFPCTGGPYLMVLGLLHDRQTYWSGAGYLVWYNLLFVLPLVIVLLLASNRQWLEKLQTWRKENLKTTRIVTGLIMILLGLVVLAM